MSTWIDSIPGAELGKPPSSPGTVGKVTESVSLDNNPLYTIDARISGIQCEITATPRANALDTLHFIIGCHCFGAKTQFGSTVFPHVASHQEGDRGTPEGVALQPNNVSRSGDRNPATRRVCLTTNFRRMRENISCIVITISSKDYKCAFVACELLMGRLVAALCESSVSFADRHHGTCLRPAVRVVCRRFGGLVLHLYQSYRDRSGVVARGGEVLARRDLTFLANSGRSCGTFAIAALAREGGWWRLHAMAPWYSGAGTPAEFRQQMCKPARVRVQASRSAVFPC
jgi:hypothetical protein